MSVPGVLTHSITILLDIPGNKGNGSFGPGNLKSQTRVKDTSPWLFLFAMCWFLQAVGVWLRQEVGQEDPGDSQKLRTLLEQLLTAWWGLQGERRDKLHAVSLKSQSLCGFRLLRMGQGFTARACRLTGPRKETRKPWGVGCTWCRYLKSILFDDN